MDQERKLLFTYTIPVRWGDMDALGHVNNATYFTYFEQARVAWLESFEAEGSLSHGTNAGPVIVNASCTFLKAVVYPAVLDVRLFGGEPGRSSFETYYEIRDAKSPETLFTTGASKVVWVDHVMGRSCPLPPEVVEKLPGHTETA